MVLICVDLFVRFLLEPWICGPNKKNKVSKSSVPKLNSEFKLATETMYDGGKPNSSESLKDAVHDVHVSENETKS